MDFSIEGLGGARRVEISIRGRKKEKGTEGGRETGRIVWDRVKVDRRRGRGEVRVDIDGAIDGTIEGTRRGGGVESFEDCKVGEKRDRRLQPFVSGLNVDESRGVLKA